MIKKAVKKSHFSLPPGEKKIKFRPQGLNFYRPEDGKKQIEDCILDFSLPLGEKKR